MFRLQPKPTCKYSHLGSDVTSVILHRKGTALRSVGERLHLLPRQNPASKTVHQTCHYIHLSQNPSCLLVWTALLFPTCHPRRMSKISIGFVCNSIWSWLVVRNRSDSFSEAPQTIVHKQDTCPSLSLAIREINHLQPEQVKYALFSISIKRIKAQFVTARF